MDGETCRYIIGSGHIGGGYGESVPSGSNFEMGTKPAMPKATTESKPVPQRFLPLQNPQPTPL